MAGEEGCKVGVVTVLKVGGSGRRQIDGKNAACAFGRLQGDSAIHSCKAALDECQSHALAGSRVGLKAPEDFKDAWLVIQGDARAVVGDVVQGAAVLDSSADAQVARAAADAVFEGVVEQIS